MDLLLTPATPQTYPDIEDKLVLADGVNKLDYGVLIAARANGAWRTTSVHSNPISSGAEPRTVQTALSRGALPRVTLDLWLPRLVEELHSAAAAFIPDDLMSARAAQYLAVLAVAEPPQLLMSGGLACVRVVGGLGAVAHYNTAERAAALSGTGIYLQHEALTADSLCQALFALGQPSAACAAARSAGPSPGQYRVRLDEHFRVDLARMDAGWRAWVIREGTDDVSSKRDFPAMSLVAVQSAALAWAREVLS